MSTAKEDYLAEYRRLAAEFADRPRVVTDSGLGYLAALDLDQDSGYGVSVRVDYIEGRGHKVIARYSAPSVRLFSEFKESLQSIYKSPVYDGDLISKAHRDVLSKLHLVGKVEGLNYITPAGIKELLTLGWITKEGRINW